MLSDRALPQQLRIWTAKHNKRLPARTSSHNPRTCPRHDFVLGCRHSQIMMYVHVVLCVGGCRRLELCLVSAMQSLAWHCSPGVTALEVCTHIVIRWQKV